MFHKALRYAKYTHPTKPIHWLKKKYWGQLNLDRLDFWTFGDKRTGKYLLKLNWFPIERHTLVKGTAYRMTHVSKTTGCKDREPKSKT